MRIRRVANSLRIHRPKQLAHRRAAGVENGRTKFSEPNSMECYLTMNSDFGYRSQRSPFRRSCQGSPIHVAGICMVGLMTPKSLLLLAAICLILPSCGTKQSGPTVVATRIAYSHPRQVSGGITITRRQESGTVGGRVPSTAQAIALTDENEVFFSQKTDVSVPGVVRVTIDSSMDGYPAETKVIDHSSEKPNPPVVEFKNGLRAVVAVDPLTE